MIVVWVLWIFFVLYIGGKVVGFCWVGKTYRVIFGG